MSEEQLQELSREAAGCLPPPPWNFELLSLYRHDTKYATITGTKTRSAGMVSQTGSGDIFWLHESTEACTEIMVRVLWPADQTVHGFKSAGGTYTARAICDPSNEGDANDTIGSSYANEKDPMLAFRVAVLRALIALKAPS